MVKLADTLVSGTSARKGLGVQVPLRAVEGYGAPPIGGAPFFGSRPEGDLNRVAPAAMSGGRRAERAARATRRAGVRGQEAEDVSQVPLRAVTVSGPTDASLLSWLISGTHPRALRQRRRRSPHPRSARDRKPSPPPDLYGIQLHEQPGLSSSPRKDLQSVLFSCPEDLGKETAEDGREREQALGERRDPAAEDRRSEARRPAAGGRACGTATAALAMAPPDFSFLSQGFATLPRAPTYDRY